VSVKAAASHVVRATTGPAIAVAAVPSPTITTV
jgi:hypothetical protein